MVQDLQNKPLITVITVSLNSESTIHKTIESVLNQTFENVEFIIIDGMSSDNTVGIIKEHFDRYREQNNLKRLSVISEKDSGISSAFNKGIKLANGNFLLFLNSDDYLIDENVFQDISNLLINDENLYCGNIFIDSLGKFVKCQIEENLKEYNVLHPATFFGKKVFEKIGFFDESFKIGMDTEFFFRARKMNIKFENLNRTITIFSVSGISNNNVIRALYENMRARKLNKATNFFREIYYFLNGIRVLLIVKFRK